MENERTGWNWSRMFIFVDICACVSGANSMGQEGGTVRRILDSGLPSAAHLPRIRHLPRHLLLPGTRRDPEDLWTERGAKGTA